MKPELAELELRAVAKTFKTPKSVLRGFVKERRRDIQIEEKRRQGEAQLNADVTAASENARRTSVSTDVSTRQSPRRLGLPDLPHLSRQGRAAVPARRGATVFARG
jgi:hypothetical protein